MVERGGFDSLYTPTACHNGAADQSRLLVEEEVKVITFVVGVKPLEGCLYFGSDSGGAPSAPLNFKIFPTASVIGAVVEDLTEPSRFTWRT